VVEKAKIVSQEVRGLQFNKEKAILKAKQRSKSDMKAGFSFSRSPRETYKGQLLLMR